MSIELENEAREAFEARQEFKSNILWKRGGSVFAENVPSEDYVDGRIQRDWLLWRAAWFTSRGVCPECCNTGEVIATDGSGPFVCFVRTCAARAAKTA